MTVAPGPAPVAPRSRADAAARLAGPALAVVDGVGARLRHIWHAAPAKAAVLPSPSKKFRVVIPERLPVGEAFVPPGRSVALFRDDDGVYAISTVCTHLGCIVKPTADGFECPCHGSRFAKDGAVTEWTRASAPVVAAVSVAAGALVVDEATPVPAGTKVSV